MCLRIAEQQRNDRPTATAQVHLKLKKRVHVSPASEAVRWVISEERARPLQLVVETRKRLNRKLACAN